MASTSDPHTVHVCAGVYRVINRWHSRVGCSVQRSVRIKGATSRAEAPRRDARCALIFDLIKIDSSRASFQFPESKLFVAYLFAWIIVCRQTVYSYAMSHKVVPGASNSVRKFGKYSLAPILPETVALIV